MRILITSCPSHGHLNPVLPLASAARRAGHEVVVATGAEVISEVERRGLPALLVGPSRAEADAAFHTGHPDLHLLSPEQRTKAAVDGLFVGAAAKRAAELVPWALTWKPDIVVHEQTELAGALAAAHTGARHVVHGLGPMPAHFWESMFAPGIERLCRAWQMPELAQALRFATYLDICPPSLQPDPEPVWQRIQPMRPVAGQPIAGEELPASFHALPYPQTIHLTLGTIFHESPGVLETAIAGLRELPLNLVVTSGPTPDPARVGSQPPHVLIEPYLPHTQLLPHCRLVVAQGGAGIMLGALAHGLPQLILPQGADQFMNAEICVGTGAALALTPDVYSADAVFSAAERLLAEPDFERAAGGIRAEIDAMPGAADILDVLTAQETAATHR